MHHTLHHHDLSVPRPPIGAPAVHPSCAGRSDVDALSALHAHLASIESHVNDLARAANETRLRHERRPSGG